MTNHGDDCYFFYYSTCTKGDSCPFRHCEAAMGSETVCSLWQEGRCFRTVCKFRHMEITKNRKEIPCYWENQPAGCQKPHCAFFHEKPRFIDGTFVPPNRNMTKNDEQPHEEPAPPPATPLPNTANPQIRGVIKTETQEPVPSPTHPPVVINPADDDEDEDDQFSEEGEEGKMSASPRKLPKSDDSLNFGVSTLEEIRLRKALKASMKRAGYPIQSADGSTNGGKENIQEFFRPALYEAREETRPRTSVAERLGRRLPNADGKYGAVFPLKRSLAERLGRVLDEEEPSGPPHKALKPVKQRLGLPAEAVAPSQPADTKMESKKAPEQIRIKTLDEIKQEKAAKSQSQSDGSTILAPEINKITVKATKVVKRAVTVREDAIKTFSEVVHTKKKRQEEQGSSPKRAKHAVEIQGESISPEATDVGQVRVKTLEEIRREKAARVQAQQVVEAENKKDSDSEMDGPKKSRLLHTNKLPVQNPTKKTTDGSEKPLKSHTAAPETHVKVKTFEEIMREKRLRRQEMEEQARTSAEAEPSQKPTPDRTLTRTSRSSSTLTSDTTSSIQKLPLRKGIHLKSKAASPVNSSVTPESQSLSSSTEVPDKKTRSPQGLTEDHKPLTNNLKTPPESTTDTRVKPKLNVKPSVVKPAVQVKPGQKRKGAERSAVAEVKPLNSSSLAVEESLQQTPVRDRQVLPSSSSEAQLSSAVPCSPSTLVDSSSSSSPLREELQTVPVFRQISGSETKPGVAVTAPIEACTVPQSPVLKSPTPKPRRPSTVICRSTSSAAASTSAVDDFEELISEFTDDHLEEDVDPSIGEDDLLQELSEMIDS